MDKATEIKNLRAQQTEILDGFLKTYSEYQGYVPAIIVRKTKRALAPIESRLVELGADICGI